MHFHASIKPAMQINNLIKLNLTVSVTFFLEEKKNAQRSTIVFILFLIFAILSGKLAHPSLPGLHKIFFVRKRQLFEQE